MKDKVILVEMLYEKAEQYVKTTLELYRLQAIDKLTDVFANIVSRLAILVVVTFFFILITFGLAFYLGEVLGKIHYGFFALALFYAFFAIILSIVRKKWLEDKMNNYIINQIFKEKKDASN